MALSNYTYFEVRTTGSDTTNSGGFDINSSGFPTDGSITSANTASPVISSASYSFVASDVGAWVFIKSGTNSIPGWYRIASVNAGAATLNGSIGQAVRVYNIGNYSYGGIHPSTELGCGTAASLSSIAFGVDYSQQDAFRYTGNFIVQATTTNIVGSGITINRSWVGNIINLTSVGSGSAISGYYNVVSIGGTVATLDRSAGTAGSASTGFVGGCFLSPGLAAGLSVLGNRTYIRNGIYGIGTTVANVSGGRIQTVGGRVGTFWYGYQLFEGYSSVRGDKINPPTLKVGAGVTGISIVSLPSQVQRFDNLIFDGSRNLGVSAIRDTANPASSTYISRCKFMGFGEAIYFTPGGSGEMYLCEFTENSSWSFNTGGCSIRISHTSFYNNTFSCLLGGLYVSNCIFANNTGASTDAFQSLGVTGIYNCTFYNNGRNGINLENNGGNMNHTVINNIFSNNGTGVNSNISELNSLTLENNIFHNNTNSVLGRITGSNLASNLTLSANPFVDAANGNFALNYVAGAGASVRSFGAPRIFPGFINTLSYTDPGAVQNQDSPITYVNPEKSITIKAGTTSRSEYIYLNTSGYTFSTTGLSASYVRAGSARVAIPLVSQTVTGAYTSGGFCEVDATNMPGLYRIDVPNAIFNTGVKTAALEIINTTTNDRQVISYQFTQDQTLDFTQLVPTSNTVQTVGDALNAARAQGFGKWVLSGTALTIYGGDNTTIVKTFTIDSITSPTSRI